MVYKLLPINLQLFADSDEGFNGLSNLEDFVGEDEVDVEDIVDDDAEVEDEIDVEDDVEEESEVDDEVEPEPPKTTKKPAKVDNDEPKKPMSKQEYALVKEKQKNKDILKMVESLVNEVKELKGIETERSMVNKRSKLVSGYVEQGYDEAAANIFADKDMKIDSVTDEISNLKKMVEELASGKQSTYDTKTQTEQAILYKQGKGQKSKTETSANPEVRETVKMTREQKADWERFKNTSWGKGKTAKEFLKSWNESFG